MRSNGTTKCNWVPAIEPREREEEQPKDSIAVAAASISFLFTFCVDRSFTHHLSPLSKFSPNTSCVTPRPVSVVVMMIFQNTAIQMAAAVDVDTKAALATAANEARGLAMDSIAAANSGHMGLPLGAAEIGASLYGSQVRLVFVLCALSNV